MRSSLPSTLLAIVHCLISSQPGATAIGYSMIVALIAMAITAALNLTGQRSKMCSACRQRDDLMPRIVAYGRRLLAARRGTALIGYSSIMLLGAIAAIAMLTQFWSGANLPPDSRIDLSH